MTGSEPSSGPASSEPIAFARRGAGEPLLLIHGSGMSRIAWRPVLPLLEAEREVIVVDLPGHGASPSAPAHLSSSPPGFAYMLADLLDQLGIDRAHAAGNSVGGWTALELAKLGRARSVVAFGPAGLWARRPLRPVLQLLAMHRAARRLRRLAPHLMRSDFGRSILLGQAFGDPRRVPAEDAAAIVSTLAEARSFRETVIATHMNRFEGGRELDVPVTVVFGQRDRIVPRSARRREELPAHVRWLEPRGLGHVPMWDDPELVARSILAE